MSAFTRAELEYLADQRLGRLATAGPDGAPHVMPVAFRHNPDTDTIDIGGHAMAHSKKWRDLAHETRVAFVVDDLLPPWRPRLIEIRGVAARLSLGGSALGRGFNEEFIRITPTRILTYGLDGGTNPMTARDVNESAYTETPT
jgi:pyridoxamine 5'-phosphate oxidase family protein